MEGMLDYLNNFAVSCNPSTSSGIPFLPTWYKYIEGETDAAGKCYITAQMPDDIGKILLAIIEILLRVGGIVAVFFVMYGGFRYITSQGEPEQTKSARQTIQNALIGLILSTVATLIVSFLAHRLINPTAV